MTPLLTPGLSFPIIANLKGLSILAVFSFFPPSTHLSQLFHLYHFAKTASLKVISDLPLAKVNGEFSVLILNHQQHLILFIISPLTHFSLSLADTTIRPTLLVRTSQALQIHPPPMPQDALTSTVLPAPRFGLRCRAAAQRERWVCTATQPPAAHCTPKGTKLLLNS